MKRIRIVMLVAVLTVTGADAATINPGLWELVVTTHIDGVKAGMPPQTIRQCVSEKNVVPRDISQNGCRISNVKVRGGNVSWEMRCANQSGQISGQGRLNYAGNRMQGQASLVVRQNGTTLKMQQTYSGRRVGNCN